LKKQLFQFVLKSKSEDLLGSYRQKNKISLLNLSGTTQPTRIWHFPTYFYVLKARQNAKRGPYKSRNLTDFSSIMMLNHVYTPSLKETQPKINHLFELKMNNQTRSSCTVRFAKSGLRKEWPVSLSLRIEENLAWKGHTHAGNGKNSTFSLKGILTYPGSPTWICPASSLVLLVLF